MATWHGDWLDRMELMPVSSELTGEKARCFASRVWPYVGPPSGFCSDCHSQQKEAFINCCSCMALWRRDEHQPLRPRFDGSADCDLFSSREFHQHSVSTFRIIQLD